MSMVYEEPTTLHFEEHRSEATSVVVHDVPPAARERFLELQRGITLAVEPFAGYRRTDIYPPSDGDSTQWVIALQFDDQESLQRWLESPERAEWTKKFSAEMGEYRVKTLPGGLGQWFANSADGSAAKLPPSWKMALTVWLGLYPTVMVLTLLVAPYTRSLGTAVSMLIGNALSVSILQWAMMPTLTKIFRRWLRAPQSAGVAFHLAGAVVILTALGGMAILFRQFAH
jgi:antibiotic biosynthesis monooxygenase (ABM) superfamily enzyme